MLVLSLSLLWGGFFSRSSIDTVADCNREITVQGTGIVRVVPDQATLRFAIVTRALKPEEARRQNAEVAARVLRAVRQEGIEERKMRLLALRLSEYYERKPDGTRYRKGFEAYREFSITVDDLEKIPELVARVVAEGSNRLLSLSYDVKDRQAVEQEALQQAARNAYAKARVLAQTLGASLGDILRVHEQSLHMPYPLYQVRTHMDATAKAEAVAEPEAYAAGEIEVRASLQATFSLYQGKMPRSR